MGSWSHRLEHSYAGTLESWSKEQGRLGVLTVDVRPARRPWHGPE